MAGTLHHVLCNGSDFVTPRGDASLRLDYRPEYEPNVRIGLPLFVEQLTHVPPRLLDLLEIAAYVYCADRQTDRGAKDAVEYHGWSRSFEFHVKIRNIQFWSTPGIAGKLNAAVSYLSGDRAFTFQFEPGHETAPTSLFDMAGLSLNNPRGWRVVLFSGGLDSLSGVYHTLHSGSEKLCLVSHRSSQPQIGRTQDQLVQALQREFPNRVQHYKFYCNLTGRRAAEETQRTRMFLYASIAASIAATGNLTELSIFENGVTSLNFPRRQDLLNARATRTTHPKTIALLEDVFSAVSTKKFHIRTPFFWKTKADVVSLLQSDGGAELIPSAVSCSRTFLSIGSATHCGECSQCVDRRFASYAAGVEEIDDSVPYATDFIRQPFSHAEARTTAVDFVRQARDFAKWNSDHFAAELFSSVTDVLDYVGAGNDEQATAALATLCQRHGRQVMAALERIRAKHDRLDEQIIAGSLLSLIASREYLKPPVARLVEAVCNRLSTALPLAFQTTTPTSEADLNDKISAILAAAGPKFAREHPTVQFGLAKTTADHAASMADLVIETKYLRGSTSPSRASDGIAADLTKYASGAHILFLVYDPQRSISDDATFCEAFERRGGCTVHIVR